eukprot:7812759-Alexandrium_andersonii.AAC.1
MNAPEPLKRATPSGAQHATTNAPSGLGGMIQWSPPKSAQWRTMNVVSAAVQACAAADGSNRSHPMAGDSFKPPQTAHT